MIIGLILILSSALFSFQFLHSKHSDKQNTEKIIKEIFTNNEDPDFSEIKEDKESNEKSQPDVSLSKKYLGYIEFSNYGVKRLITSGTNQATLDKGLVGKHSYSANLDDEFGNIILAGHNTKNIFQKLHYMKIGDEIKIVSHKNTYYYNITEKHVISDNDFSYFKKTKDKKILTLITCKNNGKKRLIVIAELKGVLN